MKAFTTRICLVIALVLLLSAFVPPAAAGEIPVDPPDPDTSHLHKMVGETFRFCSHNLYCTDSGCVPFAGYQSCLVKWNGISWFSSPVVGNGVTDSNGDTCISTSEDSPGINFYKLYLPAVEHSWTNDLSAHIMTPVLSFNQSEYREFQQGVAIALADYGLNTDPKSRETATITLESSHYEAGILVIDKVHTLAVYEGDTDSGSSSSSLFTGRFPFTTTYTADNDGKIYVSGTHPGRLRVRNADNSLKDGAVYNFTRIPGSTSPDLNDNDIIDWGDVVKCSYMSWDLVSSDADRADFNGNGIIDWGDVVKLAYYYWGLIPTI